MTNYTSQRMSDLIWNSRCFDTTIDPMVMFQSKKIQYQVTNVSFQWVEVTNGKLHCSGPMNTMPVGAVWVEFETNEEPMVKWNMDHSCWFIYVRMNYIEAVNPRLNTEISGRIRKYLESDLPRSIQTKYAISIFAMTVWPKQPPFNFFNFLQGLFLIVYTKFCYCVLCWNF